MTKVVQLNNRPRKTQAVILGWDVAAPGGDKTVYHCRECGFVNEPCNHLDAYFRAHGRGVEMKRIGRGNNGRT